MRQLKFHPNSHNTDQAKNRPSFFHKLLTDVKESMAPFIVYSRWINEKHTYSFSSQQGDFANYISWQINNDSKKPLSMPNLSQTFQVDVAIQKQAGELSAKSEILAQATKLIELAKEFVKIDNQRGAKHDMTIIGYYGLLAFAVTSLFGLVDFALRVVPNPPLPIIDVVGISILVTLGLYGAWAVKKTEPFFTRFINIKEEAIKVANSNPIDLVLVATLKYFEMERKRA